MIAVSGGEALGFVSAVLGLTVLLGTVVAVLFSQLRRNTTAIVREENADLRARLQTVETLEEQCKERLAKQEATTQTLTDMVTGASAVAELSTVIAFNHAEMMKNFDQLARRLARRRA